MTIWPALKWAAPINDNFDPKFLQELARYDFDQYEVVAALLVRDVTTINFANLL